jgi:hypothetical protein
MVILIHEALTQPERDRDLPKRDRDLEKEIVISREEIVISPKRQPSASQGDRPSFFARPQTVEW